MVSFVVKRRQPWFLCLQEKNIEDAASKAKVDFLLKEKDTEIAEVRKELVRAQEALAALQTQSDQRVSGLEQTAAAALEQALEDAQQRSQQEHVALRRELESKLQQSQASQRIASDRFTIEQAAIAERAERAE